LDSPLAIFIAISTVGAAMLISLFNVYKHLQHYNKPEVQLYIIRILLIVPVYALGSFLSLYFEDWSLYFDTVRDAYEAFVIYCFLMLLLEYCGGESNCVNNITTDPAYVAHPWPFCCLREMRTDAHFLKSCKRWTLQFVFVKPLMAILSLIMLALGKYKSTEYTWFLNIVYNVSYTMALYYLMLFYMACKKLLVPYKPVGKFFAVKLIVFMTFWQSLAITNAPGMTEKLAERWNDFVLCVEVLLFAVLHSRSFTYTEFRAGIPDASVLRNVGQVLSVRDVVQDTVHSFQASYQDYVLHKNPGANNASVTMFRTTTYIVGNVDASSKMSLLQPRGNGGNASGRRERTDSFELHDNDHAAIELTEVDHDDHEQHHDMERQSIDNSLASDVGLRQEDHHEREEREAREQARRQLRRERERDVLRESKHNDDYTMEMSQMSEEDRRRLHEEEVEHVAIEFPQ